MLDRDRLHPDDPYLDELCARFGSRIVDGLSGGAYCAPWLAASLPQYDGLSECFGDPRLDDDLDDEVDSDDLDEDCVDG